jgi:acetyltransferase-like isoleucine patch superfamily enzyme
MMLSLPERIAGQAFRLGFDRARALLLRARGARVGRKVRLAARCVVERPWCLELGERCQLEHQVFIKATADTARIRLGRGVFVGFSSEFDVSDELTIGDGVLIAPGCFITDHSHRHDANEPIAAQGTVRSFVRIEDDVWLGTRSVILPGVTIGRGAIVGAGAVVNRDVSPFSIVAGVPARVIGARRAAS